MIKHQISNVVVRNYFTRLRYGPEQIESFVITFKERERIFLIKKLFATRNKSSFLHATLKWRIFFSSPNKYFHRSTITRTSEQAFCTPSRCPNKTEARLSLHSPKRSLWERCDVVINEAGEEEEKADFWAIHERHCDAYRLTVYTVEQRARACNAVRSTCVGRRSCIHFRAFISDRGCGFGRFIFVVVSRTKEKTKKKADTSEKWLIARKVF